MDSWPQENSLESGCAAVVLWPLLPTTHTVHLLCKAQSLRRAQEVTAHRLTVPSSPSHSPLTPHSPLSLNLKFQYLMPDFTGPLPSLLSAHSITHKDVLAHSREQTYYVCRHKGINSTGHQQNPSVTMYLIHPAHILQVIDRSPHTRPSLIRNHLLSLEPSLLSHLPPTPPVTPASSTGATVSSFVTNPEHTLHCPVAPVAAPYCPSRTCFTPATGRLNILFYF